MLFWPLIGFHVLPDNWQFTVLTPGPKIISKYQLCTSRSQTILFWVNRRGKNLQLVSPPKPQVCLCRHCLMSLGTELPTVVLVQHIHPSFILVIFSAVLWRTKFTTIIPKRKRSGKKIFLCNCKYSFRASSVSVKNVYMWVSAFLSPAVMWMTTTSFWMLTANRNIDSSAKYAPVNKGKIPLVNTIV
jgi:hypothetical protein